MPFGKIDTNMVYENTTHSNALSKLQNLDSENSFSKALDYVKREQKTTLQNLSATEDKELREQTDQFEAIFLQMMLKDAIKNENPLYPKQAGSDIYHSMYIEQISRNLAGGFGYSELLYNYLKGIYA